MCVAGRSFRWMGRLGPRGSRSALVPRPSNPPARTGPAGRSRATLPRRVDPCRFSLPPRLSGKVKITREFFQRDPRICSRELIGCELLWNGAGGVIVETEAYSVRNDEACHTFHRPSSRAFVSEKPPGTAYVYLNYGMHWLLNFLVKGGAEDGFVLIRALEPTRGIKEMRHRRGVAEMKNLCSGPGKLTRALGVDGDFHGRDIFESPGLKLILPSDQPEILEGPRIGISRSAELPWRFTKAGSRFLSAPMKAP